jgi:hypothetical protein
MNSEAVLPSGATLVIQSKTKGEFTGGASSLYSPWLDISPTPFDTVSLWAAGISMTETPFVISLDSPSEKTTSRWFKETLPQMWKLLFLPREWKSDNPSQINPKNIEKMIGLLLNNLDFDTPSPTVVPTSRGGVQVEWHQNGVDLEIETYDSGKAEYFFCGSAGEQEGPVANMPGILRQFTKALRPGG